MKPLLAFPSLPLVFDSLQYAKTEDYLVNLTCDLRHMQLTSQVLDQGKLFTFVSPPQQKGYYQ